MPLPFRLISLDDPMTTDGQTYLYTGWANLFPILARTDSVDGWMSGWMDGWRNDHSNLHLNFPTRIKTRVL